MRVRRQSLATVFALFLIGCTSAPPAPFTPPPTDPAAPSTGPSPEAPATTALPPASANPASTLSFAIEAAALFGTLAPWYFQSDDDHMLHQRLVMSALYRLDDQARPVPDLAGSECEISDDGLTITCRLRDAWFHDGAPVTAEDVVFSFEAAVNTDEEYAGRYASVTAVDQQTVRFALDTPDSGFEHDLLASVPIGSRRIYEAAYRELASAARGFADDASDVLATIEEALGPAENAEDPETECAKLVPPLQDLWATAPRALPDDAVLRERLPFMSNNSCETASLLSRLLREAMNAAGEPSPAKIGKAMLATSVRVPRVGSGPFRFERYERGAEVSFVAHERYHHGVPAVQRMVGRFFDDDDEAVDALRRGEVDVLPPASPERDAQRYDVLRDEPAITIAQHTQSAYTALHFNVRPGRLFEQVELRRALEQCLDKASIVDAATIGTGVPIQGPLLPPHWAYEPGLAAPAQDVSAARRLIESAGWALGDDGVYVRDGRRLAGEIWVRAEREPYLRFVELLGQRARDCGMELDAAVAPFIPDLREDMLWTPPHIPPERQEPFDVYFGGWTTGTEPSEVFLQFHSEQTPDINFVGYSNPRFDELAQQAKATFGARERARLYRDMQAILADDVPYIFGWAPRTRTYFTSDLSSLAGPLNLESPLWDWQLEKLMLRRGTP